LKDEIELSNRIRSLLEEISFTRASEYPRISGKDFIKLNHATYYADRHVLVSELESISNELKKREAPWREGPRIMLTGSTMADGDYKLVDLLEETGASIVIEEFSEGVRHYQQRIKPNGDLIRALADRYLRRRVPPAFFHGVIKNRFDCLLKLIKDFKVNGVIWYSLMYRDSYDREGLLFSQVLNKEVGIPLLKLNSDYDVAETGPMRTRIETFIEIIKRGK
jgi:benzoyl-CoA reductase/2-hydroxyglutaryl-CoA dehydratase subunit BcrC/BadD/HgdB